MIGSMIGYSIDIWILILIKRLSDSDSESMRLNNGMIYNMIIYYIILVDIFDINIPFHPGGGI